MYNKLVDNLYYGYSDKVNVSQQWLPMDTESLFDENLKKNPELIEQYGWTKTSISYKFNNYGFRCNDFEIGKPSVMFLGCSFTLGVGLPSKNTFAHLVAETLGLENYNLGIGGSSNDTAFRLASFWIAELKPEIVILMSPMYHRFELIDEDSCFLNLTPQFINTEGNRSLRYALKAWIASDYNFYLNQLKNKKAIAQLCNEQNTKFLDLDVNTDFKHIENDFARDFAHNGIKSHRRTASHILKILKNKE